MRTDAEIAPRVMSALPVPEVDTAAAEEAAERLRQVSRLGAAAQSVVEQAWVEGWSGGASSAYYDLRGRAVGRLEAASGFARDVSTAIDRYADAVQPAVSTMRRSAVDLELALNQQAMAADDVTLHAARTAVDDAHASYDRAKTAYDTAVADIEARLAAVPTWPDEDRTFTQHVADGGRRLWREAVTEPLTCARMLALGWVDDPSGWRAMVSGIPGGVWDQVTHPRRTIDELLAGEDVRNGQIGAALGTWLSMAYVPSKVLRVMASPEIRTRYARNMADPKAPRPRVQSVDEMLAGVHLAGHEHHDLGHAVRRHVDVDDDYLRDRLDNGTLLDDGKRGSRPPDASSWNDLETAEIATTYVLQHHEAALREFADSDKTKTAAFRVELPEPLGRVMSPDGDGVVVRDSGKVKVAVGKKDGQVYIVSAYLEVP